MNHDTRLNRGMRSLLLELARREDDLAAREAATIPYWAPCPESVVGRRMAAIVLRAEADTFLAGGAA